MKLSSAIKRYYTVPDITKQKDKFLTVDEITKLISSEQENPFKTIITNKISIPVRNIIMDIVLLDNHPVLVSKKYSDSTSTESMPLVGFESNTLLYHTHEFSIVGVKPVVHVERVSGDFRIEKYVNNRGKELHLINAKLPDLSMLQKVFLYYFINNKTGGLDRLSNFNHVVRQALKFEVGTDYGVSIIGFWHFYHEYYDLCSETCYELRNFKPAKLSASSFEEKLVKTLSILNITSRYNKLLTLDGYRKVLLNRVKFARVYKCKKGLAVDIKDKRGSTIYMLKKI